MDLLLSRGAAINSVDNERWSALHVAVCYLNVQCVKVLLRYHIDVNLQNSDGNTALHKLLHDPIPMWKGAMDIIDAICSCGRVDFTLRNEFGCNILHAAALRGNADAMERLVTHAHHLVDVQMEDGNAALHLAALKGHREVAAILLSQNGGRAKVDLRNNLGQTPLCLAVLHKHWPLVELLAHQKIADFDGTNMCNICMERRRNVAFLCGHCACEHCAAQLNTCHMCRKTITKKINLY
ncbi:PREDICTED: E3 ubiquitin-protein ligase MIB2-like [Wasmannia auropunctata]|uniref:E3 ubiquitin-protein ligase MIB2-like n=1 Tax=Wasmannia auropunctata TaxID=64793 RepID=UPI0005EEB742|nr:PREDICTED: E3 ubiquitin-protein ligase MIB2-like [Wasmannia auropunctata]